MTISVCRRTLREMLALVPETCAEGQAELAVAIDPKRARGVLFASRSLERASNPLARLLL